MAAIDGERPSQGPQPRCVSCEDLRAKCDNLRTEIERLRAERDHYRDSYHADHAKLVEALEREKVVRRDLMELLESTAKDTADLNAAMRLLRKYDLLRSLHDENDRNELKAFLASQKNKP